MSDSILKITVTIERVAKFSDDRFLGWKAQIWGLPRGYVHDLLESGKKSKGPYSSSWEPHLRATGPHLPYGITQC